MHRHNNITTNSVTNMGSISKIFKIKKSFVKLAIIVPIKNRIDVPTF